MQPDSAARPAFSKIATDLAALLEGANAGIIQVLPLMFGTTSRVGLARFVAK